MAGLATCELDSLHLDSETGRPANPQLAIYTPDKVSDGFAWYKLHEELHGLPIVGFLVPASTFEVHAPSWTPHRQRAQADPQRLWQRVCRRTAAAR